GHLGPYDIASGRASCIETDLARPVTPKQREVLELVAAAPLGIPTPELAERGFSADVISRLVRDGLVSLRHDRVDRDPFQAGTAFAATEPEAGRRLTPEQATAFERLHALAAAQSFRVALLHGVTGSGKTELY